MKSASTGTTTNNSTTTNTASSASADPSYSSSSSSSSSSFAAVAATAHTLFSNRSAVFMQLKQFENALADAKGCLERAPKWPKAYVYVTHVEWSAWSASCGILVLVSTNVTCVTCVPLF